MTTQTLDLPPTSPATSARVPLPRTPLRPLRGRARGAAGLLALGVAALDVGVYGVSAGAGLAVCWTLLAVVLLGMRQRRKVDRRTAALLALLGATAVQAAVEPGVANQVVGWSLVVALAGAVRFPWHRLTDAFMAALPWGSRWRWAPRHARAWVRGARGTHRAQRSDGKRSGLRAAVVPGMVTLGFLLLLVAGNPVLARQLAWLGDALGPVVQDIPGLLDVWRVAFWGLAAGLVVMLMRPSTVAPHPSAVLDRLERAPVDGERAAWTLVGANAVFAWANSVDAVYLWFTRSLPAGISYSQYVHQGVNNLTLAVLVAAVMLTVLFRSGAPSVRARRLGHLFLLQNLMVVAGVALRDAMYMDAYGPTEKRIHVLVFLALVSVGFGLLWPFVKGTRDLRWLLRANTLAAFFTLWLVQFGDSAGVVAQWQVTHVLQGMDGQGTSRSGLVDLGVRGLPARAELALRGAADPEAVRVEALAEAHRIRTEGWRGTSLRGLRATQQALTRLGISWPAH